MLLLVIFSAVPDYPGDKNFNFLDGLHQQANNFYSIFRLQTEKPTSMIFYVIKFTSCYLIFDLGLTQRSLGAT